jgi:pimeloyl-ACP methyl ester carboxylesterase
METYADDLAALVEALDLKDVVHVGHSTGGGEVVRYIERNGVERVSKAILIGADSCDFISMICKGCQDLDNVFARRI